MGYNVLVVDDEPHIRQVLVDLFEDEGHCVYTAADGEAALVSVFEHTPDLLLADVMMPRLGGLGLSRRLRARGFVFPIVLMSAVYAEVDIPGVKFIPKPFDIEQILSTLQRVLESHRPLDNGT